jgi:hypothetical protein
LTALADLIIELADAKHEGGEVLSAELLCLFPNDVKPVSKVAQSKVKIHTFQPLQKLQKIFLLI